MVLCFVSEVHETVEPLHEQRKYVQYVCPPRSLFSYPYIDSFSFFQSFLLISKPVVESVGRMYALQEEKLSLPVA